MKKIMKNCSVFHIEQKMEFNCFLIDFFKIQFWENKTYFDRGLKRLYARHNLTNLLCIYYLIGFYMIRDFIERYFLTDNSFILENHFYSVNAPDYCFKPLTRIFCVNSSV